MMVLLPPNIINKFLSNLVLLRLAEILVPHISHSPREAFCTGSCLEVVNRFELEEDQENSGNRVLASPRSHAM